MKNLKILLTKIEFRHIFNLTEDSSMAITFSKGGVGENSVKGKFILELLQDKNYKNTLLDKKEINDEIELLKNSKIETKCFSKDLSLVKDSFNMQKIIKFEYDYDDLSKLIDFEVKPNIDKTCFVEISIKNSKETIILTGE